MFVPARRLSFPAAMVVLFLGFIVILAVNVAKPPSRYQLEERQRAERLELVQTKAGLVEVLHHQTHLDGPGWFRGKTADGRTLQVWIDEDENLTWADEAQMLPPNAAKAKLAELGWVYVKWHETQTPSMVKQTWEFTASRPEWEGASASVGVNAITGEVKYAPPSMPRLDPEEWRESWTQAALAATPLRQIERIEFSQWRVTYFLIGADSEGRQVQAWLKLKEPPKVERADSVYPQPSPYVEPVPEIMGWVYLDQGISRAKAIELAGKAGLTPREQPILDYLPQPYWLFLATSSTGERVSVKVDWKSGRVTIEPVT